MSTLHKAVSTCGIDVNADFKKAFDLVENSADHLFVTGRAGTGKSTFLQYLRENTKKKLVVLAPTGVAAVNICGQTIHSFFGFKPDITVEAVSSVKVKPAMQKLYRNLAAIVIDEISMVRADLMDCIDAFLKIHGPRANKPFGGVQMVFIGDLYQLAPVVTPQEKSIFQSYYASPYFFEGRAFKEVQIILVEFEKNYRQKDTQFIEHLNCIRTNTANQEQLDHLNERLDRDYEAPEDEFSIYLTTTNKLADQINYQRVHAIKDELFCHEGRVSGDFDKRALPTHQVLELKVGAQVILLNNDSQNRWINGSIGKIIDIFDAGYNSKAIQVELADGKRVEVEPFTWELFEFSYDEDADTIDSNVVGSFRQFPLKLAWAVTIHKSQGKTFDKVIIDIGNGTFCHGQMYVALSRCRTLEGIILKKPVTHRDILMDRRVSQFMTQFHYLSVEKTLPLEEKKHIIEDAIQYDQALEILYLKEDGQKNLRKIMPRQLRTVEYAGQSILGVEAFCFDRQAHWIFRLNCILDIRKFEAIPS